MLMRLPVTRDSRYTQQHRKMMRCPTLAIHERNGRMRECPTAATMPCHGG
jgi:hypothetical protein